MYLPVTVSGFAVFGHEVESNILDSLSQGPAVTTAEIMVASHLLTTFIIMTNPASQYFEMLLNVPTSKYMKSQFDLQAKKQS
jgi:amino acid permease